MPRAATRRKNAHVYSPKHATIRDVFGERWHAVERRPTDYGFAVYLGWPYHNGVLEKQGKPRFIITTPLAKHLRSNMQRPHHLPLPIGRKALRRLREQLDIGHRKWTDERIYWWIDRLDDLGKLSVVKFAQKHRHGAWTRSGAISPTLVWGMRAVLLGPGLVNPTGQYRKLYRP